MNRVQRYLHIGFLIFICLELDLAWNKQGWTVSPNRSEINKLFFVILFSLQRHYLHSETCRRDSLCPLFVTETFFSSFRKSYPNRLETLAEKKRHNFVIGEE